MTWQWLREDFVIAVHNELIAEHGGSSGIRDAGLLSSALARPQNQAAYGKPSVFFLGSTLKQVQGFPQYCGIFTKSYCFLQSFPFWVSLGSLLCTLTL